MSKMKSDATHVYYINCIIHKQHLVAKNILGDMQEALSAAINTITLKIKLREPEIIFCLVNIKILKL